MLGASYRVPFIELKRAEHDPYAAAQMQQRIAETLGAQIAQQMVQEVKFKCAQDPSRMEYQMAAILPWSPDSYNQRCTNTVTSSSAGDWVGVNPSFLGGLGSGGLGCPMPGTTYRTADQPLIPKPLTFYKSLKKEINDWLDGVLAL
jgi:hypothetical protein